MSQQDTATIDAYDVQAILRALELQWATVRAIGSGGGETKVLIERWHAVMDHLGIDRYGAHSLCIRLAADEQIRVVACPACGGTSVDNVGDGDRLFCEQCSHVWEPRIEGVADRVVQRVAELPDRSSPEGWPEAMLVTADELRTIIGEETQRPQPEREQIPSYPDFGSMEALDDLFNAAIDAIDYVGMANYSERQAEARKNVTKAYQKCLKAVEEREQVK